MNGMAGSSRLRAFLSEKGGSVLAVIVATCAVLFNLGYCLVLVPAKSVALVALFSCFAIVAAYLLCHLLRERGVMGDAGFFLVFLIAQGAFYLAVFTPFTVPDELFHYQCAYKYSDYLLLLNPTDQIVPMRGDDALLLAQSSPLLSSAGYSSLRDAFYWLAEDGTVADAAAHSVFGIGQNPPQLKLPAALGITLGRLLGLGAYPVFYLGRIFNFVYFAVLAYMALRFLPFGKKIFAAVSFLPMTLHLAASYSYDAGIIGLAMLLTALCLRAVYGTEKTSAPLLAGIVVVAVLLAPCKVIYSLIVLLVLLIPADRFPSRRVALAYKLGIFAAAALAVVALRLSTLLDMTGVAAPSDSGVRGEETGSFYTIGGFIDDPLAFIRLLLMTFGVQGDFYLVTTVGGSLGWFQPSITAPTSFVVVFLALLALSIVRSEGGYPVQPMRHRLLFAVVFGFGWFLVIVSLCVDHTFDTESVVQGVQGRYALPLLPLALLALRGTSFIARRDLLVPLSVAFAVMNSIYLTRIYALALLT